MFPFPNVFLSAQAHYFYLSCFHNFLTRSSSPTDPIHLIAVRFCHCSIPLSAVCSGECFYLGEPIEWQPEVIPIRVPRTTEQTDCKAKGIQFADLIKFADMMTYGTRVVGLWRWDIVVGSM